MVYTCRCYALWQRLVAFTFVLGCQAYDRSHSVAFLQAGPGSDMDLVKGNIRIAVARGRRDDTTWLHEVEPIPYDLWTEVSKDSPLDLATTPTAPLTAFHTKQKPLTVNGGSTRECGGYLSHIVENYQSLPSVTVFLQANPLHKGDYHSDSKLFSTIQDLAKNPSKVNYCSFNKLYTNWSSVPLLQKWKQALNESTDQDSGRYVELKRTLFSLLPSNGGTQCFQSAQFAVSRERIHEHPKAFYMELLDCVRGDSLGNPDFVTNKECGLLEVTWHLLFGEPSVCSREAASCRTVFEGSTVECSIVEHAKHLVFGDPAFCPKPSAASLAVETRGM